METPPETQAILHQFTAHLNQFAQNVNAQTTNTAVRELTQAAAQLASTTSTSIFSPNSYISFFSFVYIFPYFHDR